VGRFPIISRDAVPRFPLPREPDLGKLDIVQTDLMVLSKHTRAKHRHSQASENGVLSLITLVWTIWRVSGLKVRYVARRRRRKNRGFLGSGSGDHGGGGVILSPGNIRLKNKKSWGLN